MNFYFLRFDSGEFGLRQSAGQVAPAPKNRRGGADDARTQSNGSRTDVIGKETGDGHRNHHSGPGPGLDGGKNATTKIVGDVPQKLRGVQHRTHGDGSAREGDEKKRAGEGR